MLTIKLINMVLILILYCFFFSNLWLSCLSLSNLEIASLFLATCLTSFLRFFFSLLINSHSVSNFRFLFFSFIRQVINKDTSSLFFILQLAKTKSSKLQSIFISLYKFGMHLFYFLSF